MSVLGLSILIASFSFFCYKNPPSSWLITQWLRRPSISFTSKPTLDDAPTIELFDVSATKKDSVEGNGSITSAVPTSMLPPVVTKQELDRKAMPPPPFLKRPQRTPTKHVSLPNSPPTPRVSQAPSFTGSDPSADKDEDLSTPSFPALNSVQRASGGVRGPPRLNAAQGTPLIASSGGLMPPPMRSPLPNRGPPSNNPSTLAPPPTHNSIPTKPRRKVLLTPGHSPLDWAHLTSSPSINLTGLPPNTPYLRVPPSLLKQMTGRKGKDAWTILGGKVYNITPYMPYHPGGEPELMKTAGRDGTRLFGEVHPWVNWEGMLEGCLVGVAVEEGEVRSEGRLEEMD